MTRLGDRNSIRPGEMAEWPIAPVLKTGVPARVPRVRIPVSPLYQAHSDSRNPCLTSYVDRGCGCRCFEHIETYIHRHTESLKDRQHRLAIELFRCGGMASSQHLSLAYQGLGSRPCFLVLKFNVCNRFSTPLLRVCRLTNASLWSVSCAPHRAANRQTSVRPTSTRHVQFVPMDVVVANCRWHQDQS